MNASPFSPRFTRRALLTAFLCAGFYFGPVAVFESVQAGYPQQLLREHNKLRKKRNRPRLRLKSPLNRSAKKYAKVMATNRHFNHKGPAPGFSTTSQRIKAEGFKGSPTGENIAVGQTSVKDVMRSWKRSSGHKQNMLSRGYRFVGFGKARGLAPPSLGNFQANYWVANFGG